MLTPPRSLDSDTLARAIAVQFEVVGDALAFTPAGEDSWCFRMGDDLWVSVRRDLRGHVPAAYETAAQLSRSLDFVLAPRPGRDGQIVRRVDGYPVVVFPFVPSTPLSRSPASPADVDAVITMLSRLHGARVSADLPSEDYTFSFDADLDAVEAAAGHPPATKGPYTEPLYRLLRHHRAAIAAMRAEAGHLASECRADDGPLVLTHGEPIASNVLRCEDRLLIGDWGDLSWGPPERDWSHVLREFRRAPSCRSAFLGFYDRKWVLSEIAEYATIFLGDHTGDADDDAMWRRLLRYLPEPTGTR